MKQSAILRVQCPDAKGLDAALAEFIYRAGGNILHFEQHMVRELGLYLARIEWDLSGFQMEMNDFALHFTPIANRLNMKWQIALSSDRDRMAIFVSKYDHCLVDLLYRWHTGELHCDIPLIISNHPDAKRHADFYGIPFHVIEINRENKGEAEQRQHELLEENKIDLIVLARYMQILSPSFIANHGRRTINIHHSFLPAFVGAKPHHQAFARGVKLLGATAHYVTEVLDDGPIIEQDVIRISHRDSLQDLVQKGRDLEKIVLSRAVSWHLEHRVLQYANKTVVFD
ncbi:MAG TPA: formyltetrahydrofolate deformylase [Candidatus Saccharimonadales bacterium]|nr:formyltetrahydrofolate deformylase [Candidatus Saccharimonadales bacterium]